MTDVEIGKGLEALFGPKGPYRVKKRNAKEQAAYDSRLLDAANLMSPETLEAVLSAGVTATKNKAKGF